MTPERDPNTVRGAVGVEVIAHAKINLRLRILARETSGFHQIETLFLRLALGDTVRVRRTSGASSLDVHGDVDLSALGPPEKNLAWRAAEAYFAARSERFNVAMEIEKRIPLGGGLGGGSADAAAVLIALDALSLSPVGERRLLAMAASLGSDVPFLASRSTYALAWGRGERMLALDPPTARAVLLVVPSFAVNTAEAYGWLAADRTNAPTPTSSEPLLLDPAVLSDWDEISRIATNDFEPVVATRHPELQGTLTSLRSTEDLQLSLMTGSGSTLVAVGCAGKTIARVRAPETGAVSMREIATQTASRVEPVSAIE